MTAPIETNMLIILFGFPEFPIRRLLQVRLQALSSHAGAVRCWAHYLQRPVPDKPVYAIGAATRYPGGLCHLQELLRLPWLYQKASISLGHRHR
jgi:hypothetical protein